MTPRSRPSREEATPERTPGKQQPPQDIGYVRSVVWTKVLRKFNVPVLEACISESDHYRVSKRMATALSSESKTTFQSPLGRVRGAAGGYVVEGESQIKRNID